MKQFRVTFENLLLGQLHIVEVKVQCSCNARRFATRMLTIKTEAGLIPPGDWAIVNVERVRES